MHVPVVIVGAGPGGLSMSHHLSGAGIDHVVLERGDVANSWRNERWDSLRLLTPNWMTTLPGYGYAGNEPDGFMTASETVSLLDAYRASFDAPIVTNTAVTSVHRGADGFEVETENGQWRCDAVVAASGASSEPRIPPVAADMPASVKQITALEYRRPGLLPATGRVLVVGASASGVQIADELARAGRDVTIAVGEHIRLPRSYRGYDIYFWLYRIGQLDERYDEVDDVNRARRHASVQLVGNDEHRNLDLNALQEQNVQVVGRLMAVSGSNGQCSGSLPNLVKNADLKQARLLRRIDESIDEHSWRGELSAPDPPAPTRLHNAPTEIDLRAFSTVIWATGYRPAYKWLPRNAFDVRGRPAHDGGVGAIPGLYFLGLPFLRRRRSNLLAGVGADAADVLMHLRAHLDLHARGRVLSAS